MKNDSKILFIQAHTHTRTRTHTYHYIPMNTASMPPVYNGVCKADSQARWTVKQRRNLRQFRAIESFSPGLLMELVRAEGRPRCPLSRRQVQELEWGGTRIPVVPACLSSILSDVWTTADKELHMQRLPCAVPKGL